MSWLGEAFSYFRKLALLDNEVEKLSGAMETMKDELKEHDHRLVRVETIIEFSRNLRPAQPRLPR